LTSLFHARWALLIALLLFAALYVWSNLARRRG
jgi:hypothetical protein